MHEMGIASEIYRVAREAAEPHGPARIESVRVAVGELSAVEPDLLEFAWRAVVAEGPDQGARLVIEWRAADQYCAVCQSSRPRPKEGWLPVCPVCDSPLAVRGGDELDLLDVSLDVAEVGEGPGQQRSRATQATGRGEPE